VARPATYLQYLPAFEAVSRHGSLRQAAEELNLSPGAISLQLKKLAEATGIVLFEKSGRNVILTPSGREFSQAVALNVSQIEAAVRTSRSQGAASLPVSLSVSVPTALGVAWLSASIVEFAESRGITNVRINEATRESSVDWKVNDIAVVYDNPPFRGKSWRLLSEVRLRTVCSPILFPRLDLQHRERKLSGITLLHEDDGDEWKKWALVARVSLQSSLRVRVTSVAQAVASAVQGRGIALVSDVLTRSYLSEGRLIQPFSTAIQASAAYYIVCPEDRSEDPLLLSLMDHVSEFLRPSRG
jgi:LysR family transcriptional regulator, glycine cleavage system transcriptional activator